MVRVDYQSLVNLSAQESLWELQNSNDKEAIKDIEN